MQAAFSFFHAGEYVVIFDSYHSTLYLYPDALRGIRRPCRGADDFSSGEQRHHRGVGRQHLERADLSGQEYASRLIVSESADRTLTVRLLSPIAIIS